MTVPEPGPARATYLFVINSFGAGGAERSLLEFLPKLAATGVRPVIACLSRSDVGFEDEVRADGWDVRVLGGSGRLAKIRSLRALVRELRPALVYTALFDADIAGRLAAARTGVPVVSNLANTAYDPARLADPNVDARKLALVRMVDGLTARHLTEHFHAISEAVKESTVETMGVDPERISVVRRGRDPARLGEPSPERTATARALLGLPSDASVVVTVGRQEYQKGHRHLVDAFATVAESRPEAVLVIAGREGHASAALADQIARLGLRDRVRLLGHRSDVAEVLAAADVFAFPSVYEGLGGALIEALALGLPVVASDLPALREVVRPGENADLVPPTDSAALADALVALLDDPARRRAYAARSRQLFEEGFDADRAADEVVSLLAGIARPRG
jgi:glycosyltransferase involved in cell wall biosynthesis